MYIFLCDITHPKSTAGARDFPPPKILKWIPVWELWQWVKSFKSENV